MTKYNTTKKQIKDIRERLYSQPSWQYNIVFIGVYVHKYPKSKKQKLAAVQLSRFGDCINKQKKMQLVNETTNSQYNSFKLLQKSNALKEISAVKIIIGNYIIQKRCKTFFEISSYYSLRKIIEHYFLLNIKLWRLGYFEGTFDFLRNCGILKNNEIYFIDVGDFIDDYEKAIVILSEKRWRNRLDYMYLSKNDRNYFEEWADRIFTVSKLKSIWKNEK